MRGEKRDSGGEKAVKERKKKTHHPSDMKTHTERDRQTDQRGD